MTIVLKRHKWQKKNRESTDLCLFCPSFSCSEWGGNEWRFQRFGGILNRCDRSPNTFVVGKWHSATSSRRSRHEKKGIIFYASILHQRPHFSSYYPFRPLLASLFDFIWWNVCVKKGLITSLSSFITFSSFLFYIDSFH